MRSTSFFERVSPVRVDEAGRLDVHDALVTGGSTRRLFDDEGHRIRLIQQAQLAGLGGILVSLGYMTRRRGSGCDAPRDHRRDQRMLKLVPRGPLVPATHSST